MTVKFNNNRDLYEELSKTDNQIDEQDYININYPDYYSINEKKKIRSKNLGEKFASINSFFQDYLKGYHIPSGFVKAQKKNSLKFIKHEKLPFTLKIINIIDERTAKIFDGKEGEQLKLPLFEFHYGNGKDSLITESHLISFDLCNNEDIKIINRVGTKLNAVLKSFFERRNVILAEVNCVFGKADNKLFLVDDFTPVGLKIYADSEKKSPDPYAFSSARDIRNYSDFLLNVTSG